MITAAHHTMMRQFEVPNAFRYVALKIVAIGTMRYNGTTMSTYSAYTADKQVQFSEVEFGNDDFSTKFAFPSNTTVESRSEYNGSRRYNPPVLLSNLNKNESIGRLFDGSTSTKLCAARTDFNLLGSEYRDYDSDAVIWTSGQAVNRNFFLNTRGVDNVVAPTAFIFDLKYSAFDMSTYTKWRFYNANDTQGGTGTNNDRRWVEGEILASDDMKTWWRLDVFNNPSITGTNYALAYTGNLIPRKGDIWSDLDLTARNWENGIIVDAIGN